MADIKITNDDLLASHCRNSLSNSDNPALLGGMSLSFGNAVNLLRCSSSNVNWRLAEKIPTEDEIMDKAIYDGLVYIRDKTGQIYKKVKDKLFKVDDEYFTVKMENTVWRKDDPIKHAPKIIKNTLSNIANKKIETEPEIIHDSSKITHTDAKEMLRDIAMTMYNMKQPELASVAILTNNLLSIHSNIEKFSMLIKGADIAKNGLNTFMLVTSCVSLISDLFADKKEDNTIKELSELIISVFNGIMNRITELEKTINMRFDRLEYKIDRQSYHMLTGLKQLYYEGKTIQHLIISSDKKLFDSLVEINKLNDYRHIDTKSCFKIISNNLESFRFEKINELIACIDYDNEIERLSQDRAHDYIGKLYGIVMSVLKNDVVTGGSHYKEGTIATRIVFLKSAEVARLVNYYAELLNHTKVANPVLLKVIKNYMIMLINKLDDKKKFHDTLLQMLDDYSNELSDFFEYLNEHIETYYDNKLIEIEESKAKMNKLTSEFMNRLDNDMKIKQQHFDDELNDAISELLKMNLYNFYTIETEKMFFGYESTYCITRKIHHNNKSSLFVPLIKEAFTLPISHNPSDFSANTCFCRGGPNHGKGDNWGHDSCSSDKKFLSRPTFSDGSCAKSITNILTSKPITYLQEFKNETIRNMPKNKIPNVRSYVNVSYKDTCVKLPIPNITYSLPIDEYMKWDIGHFAIDCEINNIDDKYNLKTKVTFVENSGKIHDVTTVLSGTVLRAFETKAVTSSTCVLSQSLCPKNNTFETIIDLYLGGIYAKSTDIISVSTAMIDRHSYKTPTLSAYYPRNFEPYKGIIDNTLIIDILPDFIKILEELKIDRIDKMNKFLETTIEFKNLEEMKELYELEHNKALELIQEYA